MPSLAPHKITPLATHISPPHPSHPPWRAPPAWGGHRVRHPLAEGTPPPVRGDNPRALGGPREAGQGGALSMTPQGESWQEEGQAAPQPFVPQFPQLCLSFPQHSSLVAAGRITRGSFTSACPAPRLTQPTVTALLPNLPFQGPTPATGTVATWPAPLSTGPPCSRHQPAQERVCALRARSKPR